MTAGKNHSNKPALIAAIVTGATVLGIIGTYTDFLGHVQHALTTYAILDFLLVPSKTFLISALILSVVGFAWPQILPITSRHPRVVQVSYIVALTCVIYVGYIIISPKQMRVLYVVYEDNAPQYHPQSIQIGDLAVQGIQVSDLKKSTAVGDFRKGNIILSATDRPWHEVVAMLDESKIHATVYSLRESLAMSTNPDTDIGVTSYIAEFQRFLKSSPASVNNTLIVFERKYSAAEEQLQKSLRIDVGARPSLVFDPTVPLAINGVTTSSVAIFLGSCDGLQLFSVQAKAIKSDMAIIAPNWVRHRLTCAPTTIPTTREEVQGRRFCLVSAAYEQLLNGDFKLWTQLLIALRDLDATPGIPHVGKESEYIAKAIGAGNAIQIMEFK